MRTKKYFVGLILFLASFSFTFSQKPKQASADLWKQYELEDAEQFVVNCFEHHDIVFLGEPHHVKQHLVFLQALLPKLYRSGITNLAYEFLPYDRQSEIDKLVTSNKFDATLAKDLISSQYFEWVEIEYIDVLEKVWVLNTTIKQGRKKFRVIGLGNSSIWSSDRFLKWTEKNWTEYIEREILDKNEKALVYSGAHHSITKFQQPYYNSVDNTYGLAKKDRMGHFMYNQIGEKCMTIWLHYLWPDKNNKLTVVPCKGYIDSLVSVIGVPFAFSTKRSKLGLLKDTTSIYGKGSRSFQLNFLADGYIVLNSFCETEYTDYVELITNQNIDQVRLQAKFYGYWQNLSVKQLNDSLEKSHSNLKRSLINLKSKNCRQPDISK